MPSWRAHGQLRGPPATETSNEDTGETNGTTGDHGGEGDLLVCVHAGSLLPCECADQVNSAATASIRACLAANLMLSRLGRPGRSRWSSVTDRAPHGILVRALLATDRQYRIPYRIHRASGKQ